MPTKLSKKDTIVGIDGIVADAGLASSEANFYVDTTSKDLMAKYKDDIGAVHTTVVGESTSFTTGQVLFGDTDGSFGQDANLFWDDTAKALGVGTSSIDTSAVLEVVSTTKGAISAPKMTTAQRDAIGSPVAGLQVYNTDTNTFNYYDGTAWRETSNLDEVSVAGNFAGVWAAPQAATLKLAFVSDTQVVISIPAFSAAATLAGTIAFDTVIPVAYRPANDQVHMVRLLDNGAETLGMITIPTTGTVRMEIGLDPGVFSGTGTTGVSTGFAVPYDVTT